VRVLASRGGVRVNPVYRSCRLGGFAQSGNSGRVFRWVAGPACQLPGGEPPAGTSFAEIAKSRKASLTGALAWLILARSSNPAGTLGRLLIASRSRRKRVAPRNVVCSAFRVSGAATTWGSGIGPLLRGRQPSVAALQKFRQRAPRRRRLGRWQSGRDRVTRALFWSCASPLRDLNSPRPGGRKKPYIRRRVTSRRRSTVDRASGELFGRRPVENTTSRSRPWSAEFRFFDRSRATPWLRTRRVRRIGRRSILQRRPFCGVANTMLTQAVGPRGPIHG
jgi:hypothetical protein